MTMRHIERGFTLIELMISVAIIGLLSAIAIPSFMTYQARSRQAEAKVNLGGIYVSETTYGAEAGRYADFSTVGYSLSGTSNRYTYRSPNAAGNGGSAGVQGFDLYATGAGSSTAGGIAQPENPIVPSNAVTSAPPQPPAFTATAGGDLDSDATVDYWHINDIKLGILIPDQSDI